MDLFKHRESSRQGGRDPRQSLQLEAKCFQQADMEKLGQGIRL
jgi:hypothetical protein